MENFKKYCQKNNISLDDQKIESFKTLLTELLNYNSKVNLTAITDPEEVWTKHFLDSISLIPFIPTGTQKIIDIGAGAGFPSIPIAIMCPELKITALEATNKKTDFIKHIKEVLKLDNLFVENARAEDWGQNLQHREEYDLVLARAVAKLPTLLELSTPFLKIGGYCLFQKEYSENEIKMSEKALSTLGAEIKEIINLDLPLEKKHSLLLIEKIIATPEKYPRRAGMPEKNPIV